MSSVTGSPNPHTLYVEAVMFRLVPPKTVDGATITIPVAIFDQLLSVVDLNKRAGTPNLTAAALSVTSDRERHTATFSHPLIGVCTATASSRLEAIAAAENKVGRAVARLAE